jgi:hypothetical protein
MKKAHLIDRRAALRTPKRLRGLDAKASGCRSKEPREGFSQSREVKPSIESTGDRTFEHLPKASGLLLHLNRTCSIWTSCLSKGYEMWHN